MAEGAERKGYLMAEDEEEEEKYWERRLLKYYSLLRKMFYSRGSRYLKGSGSERKVRGGRHRSIRSLLPHWASIHLYIHFHRHIARFQKTMPARTRIVLSDLVGICNRCSLQFCSSRCDGRIQAIELDSVSLLSSICLEYMSTSQATSKTLATSELVKFQQPRTSFAYRSISDIRDRAKRQLVWARLHIECYGSGKILF